MIMLKRLISVLLILALVLACVSTAAAAGSLRIGSRGSEVTKLQNALKELGLYSAKVDGVYGRGTRTAVIAFQKANGLNADGIAGPKTLEKLYRACGCRYLPEHIGIDPALSEEVLPVSAAIRNRLTLVRMLRVLDFD